MIENIFYIVPSIVCIVWAAIFLLRKRSSTQETGMKMLCISAAYFFLYIVMFTPGMDYKYLCEADVVAVPLILALLASLVIFVNLHTEEKIATNMTMQWLYIPAFVEGGIVAVLYYIIGIDKAAAYYAARDAINNQLPGVLSEKLPQEFNSDIYQIFHFFDAVLFNILLAVMFLVVLIVCIIAVRKNGSKLGDVIRFLFKGEKTTPVRCVANWVAIIIVTVLPLAIFGRTYIIQNPWIGCTISLLVSLEIFMLCHCEAMSNVKSYTLYEMLHVSDIYYINGEIHISTDESKNVGKSTETTAEEKNTADLAETSSMSSLRAIEKNNALVMNIHKLFEEDKVWLNAELKLSTLADKLNVNRNKLSIILNHIYGKDFKTLIGELRIEEAKRILKEEPSATMEYVALHCGYRESTIFFHRFKDIVGVTPSEWKIKNLI